MKDPIERSVHELEMIEKWLDENGWDELDSERFNAWLESVGIERRGLTIYRC